MTSMKKWAVIVALIAGLPLLTGCFGLSKGGSNPVAENPAVAKSTTTVAAETNNLVTPQILAAKYCTPIAKKFSYDKPSCRLVKKVAREFFQNHPGCIRFFVKGLSKTDTILITLTEMKVKNAAGQMITVPVSSEEINLLDGNDIGKKLGDANLPPGVYHGLTFKISSARLVHPAPAKTLTLLNSWVKFAGKFEIKDGYRTQVYLRFLHKILKVWVPFQGHKHVFFPVVKISSSLEPITGTPEPTSPPTPTVTPTSTPTPTPTPPPAMVEVKGGITDLVTKTNVAGVEVTVDGTTISAVSDIEGRFTLANVPLGNRTIRLRKTEYLEFSTQYDFTSDTQSVEYAYTMHPEIIESSVANTGFFSEFFPYGADANGTYGEVAMEIPLVIDFTSLAFTKAEIVFDAEYGDLGRGLFLSYFSSTKQVQTSQDMGTWWVGDVANLGYALGEQISGNPPIHYSYDITNFVRSNPNAYYYLAARNLSESNMKMTNIKMVLSYR